MNAWLLYWVIFATANVPEEYVGIALKYGIQAVDYYPRNPE